MNSKGTGGFVAISTAEDFHSAIHGSVGSPQPGFRTIHYGKVRIQKPFSRVHTSDWANTRVNLKSRIINIDVYIDFQQNSLSLADYTRLKSLAIKGIQHYWSRNISLAGNQYTVIVQAHQRKTHGIGVDMYIETSPRYARSHNTGLIDATIFYNKGYFKHNTFLAEKDFKEVAAHEFGHSVLKYFGGIGLSWSHEGSTNIITQNVKASTPGYPATGEINLMKYYDDKKFQIGFTDMLARNVASETDVKRLIWLSKVTIK